MARLTRVEMLKIAMAARLCAHFVCLLKEDFEHIRRCCAAFRSSFPVARSLPNFFKAFDIASLMELDPLVHARVFYGSHASSFSHLVATRCRRHAGLPRALRKRCAAGGR